MLIFYNHSVLPQWAPQSSVSRKDIYFSYYCYGRIEEASLEMTNAEGVYMKYLQALTCCFLFFIRNLKQGCDDE